MKEKFITKLIQSLQYEVDFNKKELNIPYMIIPVQEALDKGHETLLEIVNQNYVINYYYDYEVCGELYQNIDIYMEDEDYYYIITFNEYREYEDYYIPSFEINKAYFMDGYVTTKSESEIQEVIKQFYLKSNNIEIREKAERLEELKNELNRIANEIVKIEIGY